jgi:virginiamycin B lyase
MGIRWHGFRRSGQAVAVAAGVALLCAAGLPGSGVRQAARPAGAPVLTSALARASGAGHVRIFPGIAIPGGITAGPDGALWFTNGDSIGRMTTTGRFTAYYSSGISSPVGITAGPDGALWFNNADTNNAPVGAVGRITTAGKVTSYTAAGIDTPVGITAGPDGALWFADKANNSIGRITTAVTPVDQKLSRRPQAPASAITAR